MKIIEVKKNMKTMKITFLCSNFQRNTLILSTFCKQLTWVSEYLLIRFQTINTGQPAIKACFFSNSSSDLLLHCNHTFNISF